MTPESAIINFISRNNLFRHHVDATDYLTHFKRKYSLVDFISPGFYLAEPFIKRWGVGVVTCFSGLDTAGNQALSVLFQVRKDFHLWPRFGFDKGNVLFANVLMTCRHEEIDQNLKQLREFLYIPGNNVGFQFNQ